MKVAVVGCGYVGLVSAVGLSSVGHEVVGIEQAPGRRAQITDGRAPFHEPGLEELLGRCLASGAFRVSGDMAEVRSAQVVLLAVQTPPKADGSNDLSFLGEAAGQLAAVLAEQRVRRVVATRSTVVPGTAEQVVLPAFAAAGIGEQTAVASNPEFLREGSAVSDFLKPDRIVLGCDVGWGLDVLRGLYEPFDAPLVLTTTASAELSKYASNALLATMVSFSNEIARMCEGLEGVDVEDVLGSVHLDRRLTDPETGQRAGIISYLKAGCGFGGSCLPKDVSALIAYSRASGGDPVLLEAVRQVNDLQAAHVVDLAERTLGSSLTGRNVFVLGAAFKGGTDDLRASPGLRIVDELLAREALVTIVDPLVRADQLAVYLDRGVRFTDVVADCAGADLCILASNAPEFADLSEVVDARTAVVDGRRAVTAADFSEPRFAAVGRGGKLR